MLLRYCILCERLSDSFLWKRFKVRRKIMTAACATASKSTSPDCYWDGGSGTESCRSILVGSGGKPKYYSLFLHNLTPPRPQIRLHLGKLAFDDTSIGVFHFDQAAAIVISERVGF